MAKSKSLIPTELIQQAILLIRGEKVMLDTDLAALYGVETKQFNRAVRRHLKRFPQDFMFQLTKAEFEGLRCQFGTSNSHGGRRYPPYVFTEQGVAMLSSVLNSPRAIQANIEIMRAFVQLRKLLSSNEDLKRKLENLEKKYDKQFRIVFQAIKELMEPLRPSQKRQIGFASRNQK
jgi:predicted aldo/keto reductase-like oxidoreductase